MENNFFDTIHHLRDEEELLLFNTISAIPEEEEQAVCDYLEREYERECLDYPFGPPAFNQTAALWGAKSVYNAAQLFLNRKRIPKDPKEYLPPFQNSISPDSILSVDLCLRFLPSLMNQSKFIDPEDELIEILEILLADWHYSGIRQQTKIPTVNFKVILESKCLSQLYVDRIISKKARVYLENEDIRNLVLASLGDQKEILWSELILHE